ncbi:signal transduction histidine kinase/ActR/RegA family two-component response regulator [Azospirillum fermentarium]|uniref:hybrid sensor histidine kinase/response regulator n=1 Tax=Azospirillum fermentarium TaxID=1233114 RepID=UPI0022261370|nr:ATP-binding protein [Azospirillum fermentarium]MCW2248149.1 signal transduction histidine kinase/ActR/RegA family two-component response regulator [Azospirillum fermentarium]
MRLPLSRFLSKVDTRAALAGLVLAMGAVGGVAWGVVTALDYTDTLERAESNLRQSAELLETHSRSALIRSLERLDRVSAALDGGGMAAVAGDGLPELLSAPVGTVSVMDGSGRDLFGPAIDFHIPSASALRAMAAADGGTGILMAPGDVHGGPVVAIGRRIAGRSGEKEGAVFVTQPSASLSAVLRVLDDGGRRIAGLFRIDGSPVFGAGDPIPGLFDGGGAVGSGTGWLGGQSYVMAWRRMSAPPGGALPVVAVVAEPRTHVLAPWWSRVERAAVVAGASLAALLALGVLAWGSLRREETAVKALAEAKARLEQRVDERTADLSAANQKLAEALSDAERANAAKGRFLAAANHDLRQPFQALRLFHHLLGGRLKDAGSQSIAQKMGEALESGEKLLHSLLEVATLDAGVVRPVIAAVPIAPVLNDAVGEFREAAAAKGLEVRLVPSRAVVRTDPAMLGRILHHLLGNAIAFTSGGGILIGCRHRGQWLRIEVWDTGAGIPADQLDAIFEDFVQLNNPERDRRRGLGLGLSKVRRKAALLGHTVEVRSRPGHGSVFSIVVPIAAADSAATAATVKGGGAAAPDNRRILVVEDDPMQRAAIQLLLETWGHTVTAAADGEAALAAVRLSGGMPEVIVTDFRLPGALTGVDIVRAVGDIAGHPVPGVILTGDTAPERIREAVATGCRLLHKPFTPSLLKDALAAIGAPDPASPRQHAVTATI